MKHLILVGACYLDTVLSVPWYPEEDSKLRATSIRTRRGGNCPNALEVIQQLLLPEDGVKAYLVATLPSKTSPATSSIIASFGDETSVSFQHCLYRQNHTEAASCYIIRSLESGSRTIVNHNDLPEMTTSEFEYIARSFSPDQQTWWHFEGRVPETTLHHISTLRRLLPDSKISVEIEKPGRDGLTDLASAADVVFYSRTWAESRGHASPQDCLMKEQHSEAPLKLCTWGENGAALRSHSSRGCIHCPAKQQDQEISVIDAVGAGDTFIAGMLYCLVCHSDDQHCWTDHEKLGFSVRLATRKVQQEGFAELGAYMLSQSMLLSATTSPSKP